MPHGLRYFCDNSWFYKSKTEKKLQVAESLPFCPTDAAFFLQQCSLHTLASCWNTPPSPLTLWIFRPSTSPGPDPSRLTDVVVVQDQAAMLVLHGLDQRHLSFEYFTVKLLSKIDIYHSYNCTRRPD